MDFEHGVHGKASGQSGTFMKHLRSWMYILWTERYANYKTSMHACERTTWRSVQLINTNTFRVVFVFCGEKQ